MAPSHNPASDSRSPFDTTREKSHAKRMGMYWFLGALAILFLWSVGAYAWMRVTNPLSPPFGALSAPPILWASTLALVGSSLTLHRAELAIAREQQARFKRWLIATIVLAGVFLASQAVSVADLMKLHFDPANFSELNLESTADAAHFHRLQIDPNKHIGKVVKMPMFGFIVAMIVLHALHVLGGLIPMGFVAKKAFTGGYDHESYMGVTLFAMYWHFLDVVWLVLFSVFACESLAPWTGSPLFSW